MSTRVELELKYRVRDRAAAERLLSAPALAGLTGIATVRTVQMEDRYVDTSDHALDRAGFVARIRHESGATILSVKTLGRGDGGVAALHRREELEGPAQLGAQPTDWPPSAARSLILELCGDAPLVETVTIRQVRQRRTFAAEGTEVELSLDDVDVVSRGDLVARFTELEIELRSGDPESLTRIAEAIDREAGLEPAATSKYEAALLALGRPAWEVVRPKRPASNPVEDGDGMDWVDHTDHAVEPEAPAHDALSEGARHRLRAVGKSPGVTADDSVAEAGRKVLRFHFARLLASEDGTRSGVDPEDLHRMRVATRRLRAAWRIFGDAYLPDETRRFPRELRALGRRLGAVRDLDVLIGSLDTYADGRSAAEAADLEPLLAAWRADRDTARAALLAELDSPGYRRFLTAFEAFVSTEGAFVRPVRATEPHRVRDTAPSRIWGAHERVRAYEGVLPWADVATLHELRIAAKWLRYAIEFVRDVLGPGAGPLIERVVGLQDHLGLLHDADVAADLARRYLVDRAADLRSEAREAIGHYIVDRERELRRLRRSAGAPWRRVAGIGFRRALARELARL